MPLTMRGPQYVAAMTAATRSARGRSAAACLRELPVSYAADDGMPFPGWAPPALDAADAAAGYEAGERIAVLAGDPRDPQGALVLDRRNGRVVLTSAGAGRVVALRGGAADVVPVELRTIADAGDRWVMAQKGERLRILDRRHGAPLWTGESFARQPHGGTPGVPWPAWEHWAEFAEQVDAAVAGWQSLPETVDADGWLLDVLNAIDIASRWRELARRYDAPRAVGTRPDVLAKLAEPRGWMAAGRRWRRQDSIDGTLVRTDCAFSTGAGGAGEVTLGVEQGPVTVTLTLAAATARLETERDGAPGSPAHPRPSTGAQVAVSAVLDLAGEVHDAVLSAVGGGAVPSGWDAL